MSSCQAYVGNDGVTRRYLAVETKALSGNINELLEIIDQTVTKMLFDKTESIRLIIKDRISKLENQLTQNGHSAASTRALSHINSAYAFKDASGGIGYFRFLLGIDANFSDGVVNKLKEIAGSVFASEKLTAGISSEEKDIDMASAIAGIFPEKSGKYTPDTAERKTFLSEGVITPGKVQYVAAGGDFRKYGHKFTGAMKVLETVLRYEYLWTKIRIQGGAYGASAVFDRNGSMYFASYRDPKLAESLAAYKGLPDWLERLDLPERELTKYIIGTISAADVPLTNSMRLSQTALAHIKGVPQAMRQKTRDEILNLTLEDLRALGKVVRDTLSENYLCVVGGSSAIEANKELFKAVKHI